MDSFNTKSNLTVGDKNYQIFNPSKIDQSARLPYCLKILLENLLRHEDGKLVTKEHIEKLLAHKPGAPFEIAYRPARVLMQDFTGVPALVDLAAMRDAVHKAGGDPSKINPLQPVELVIDHSVQVDRFGDDSAFDLNTKLEFERNRERYEFLKWGQKAFSNFKVVPPGTGIVHQVNIEFLARVIFSAEKEGVLQAYPDTLVGTDSHTTMANGIGILGWGVGGIEAEASMLGQSISMLVPPVVGFELTGELPEGATATDLVLRIVQMLREHGAVGKFVEFYGNGLDKLSPGDRCTIANMAPEYGATCGIFPIDQQSIRYLEMTGRSQEAIRLIEAYAKETGLWRDDSQNLQFDESLSLDLSEIVPCLAGPKRPQDRIALTNAKTAFAKDFSTLKKDTGSPAVEVSMNGNTFSLEEGAVVIAAITSCTNTSNPSVMLAAGLVAKKAQALGLHTKPWVKTSLAPGSRAVTGYLEKAGLMEPLQALGFYTVGYGCTTCIGNSGPLPTEIEEAIDKNQLVATAVLSGNRNFEGRIHPKVRMNYLASPPLVVAYALAGQMNFDPYREPLGQSHDGNDVYLHDIWPSHEEIVTVEKQALEREQFISSYANIFDGDKNWQALTASDSVLFDWADSGYIALPPYFDNLGSTNESTVSKARVLAYLGDSITTDHISPAGSINAESPAGQYLQTREVKPHEFNSYGSRRGSHHVMMRGTFANIRLRNKLVPELEGGYTKHFPSGEQMSIYDAAMRYQEEGIPSIVLAGKEYGSGSSRDWAAKGPYLQGVKAILAESFERIHRSNLVGMGILPLQFMAGESAELLGLNGSEIFTIDSPSDGIAKIRAETSDGKTIEFTVTVRIDTPHEYDYYANGGILPYVLSRLN